MTGPEHYRAAEEMLDEAKDVQAGSAIERYLLAAAQVHATLALAAATAMQPSNYSVARRELIEWQNVCWPTDGAA